MGVSVDTGIAVDDSEKGKTASFGVRPEDLDISSGDDFLFEGTVSIVEALGEVTLLYVHGLTGDEPIIAKLPGHQEIVRDQKVRFHGGEVEAAPVRRRRQDLPPLTGLPWRPSLDPDAKSPIREDGAFVHGASARRGHARPHGGGEGRRRSGLEENRTRAIKGLGAS